MSQSEHYSGNFTNVGSMDSLYNLTPLSERHIHTHAQTITRPVSGHVGFWLSLNLSMISVGLGWVGLGCECEHLFLVITNALGFCVVLVDLWQSSLVWGCSAGIVERFTSDNVFGYRVDDKNEYTLQCIAARRVFIYRGLWLSMCGCEFIDSIQINKNKTTHRKQFENLLQQHNKDINIKFNEQWFVNTTNKHIPTNVQRLLSLGPMYSLPLTRAQFPLLKVIAEGEDLVRTTDDKEEQEIARTKFTTLIDDHLHKTNVKKRDKFILGTVAQTKKYLKDNKDVLILSADKGGKTVAMDSKEYKSKMHAIIHDMCSYKRLKIDPTSKFKTKNNKLVEKLYKENLISIEEKNKLTSKTAIAPRIYGLPKVHKEGTPLRPICSSINAPSYKMCRYISSILKNVTKDSKYNVKDAIDFKTKIKNVRLTDDEILISFDVVSLFPSIPVNLAIAMIEKKWDLIKNHTKIPRGIFKELALFCIKDSRYFKYEDKTYEQLKGMPMGSPASPIIADIIMEELLDVSLSKIPKPRIITKYVDDIFAIVKKTDVESTLDALNSFHSQIQFTMELEKDNKLPYLDCNILRDDNCLRLNWYQKPTATGRLINYNSKHNKSIIHMTAINFIDRILRISDAEFHKENEIKIRQILTTNDFPNRIISRLINRVKNKTLDEDIKTKTIEEPDHNKDKSYKPMTYVEGFSERFFKSDGEQ
ncbi:uncharacterized protein LOC142224445 [Haematobia irritans]|uniref:uncharacterized protein LOC142224445 n=1 Tax=Haematobia irritans TaxID=7368 RepID=UPI003F4F8A83